jgi:hypothetical protein
LHNIPTYNIPLHHRHPQSGNPNTILLCGFGKSVGKKLNERSLGDINRRYKREYFPKLIEDPNVPPEDKQKIRELLKKPWNPYREISNTERTPSTSICWMVYPFTYARKISSLFW